MLDPDRIYRPRELAATGVPRDVIYAALHTGELKAIRSGSRFLIPGHCYQTWLREVTA